MRTEMSRRLDTGLLTLLLAVAACYSTLNWCRSYSTLHWPDMRIGGMLDGTARKPFVSRTLVPAVYKPIATATEGQVRPLRRWLMHHDLTRQIVENFQHAHRIDSPDRAVVYVLLVWVSLFLLGVGIVLFLRVLGHLSIATWAVAATALVLWPLLKTEERGIYFMYDPFTPTLVLWTFYAYYRRLFLLAWVGFIACFLNRETALLLPLVAAYTILPGAGVRGKLSTLRAAARRGANRPWLRPLMVAGAALTLALLTRKFVVAEVYRDAMGQTLEFHLLDTTLEFDYILHYLPRMAAVLALFYVVALRNWSSRDELFQGAALMFAAQLLAGAAFGVIDEVRQYGELYGLGAVLAGTSLLSSNRAQASAEATTADWRSQSYLTTALSVGGLVFVVWSSVVHWKDALDTYQRLDHIKLSERPLLGRLSAAGEPWNADGNYVFQAAVPAFFLVGEPLSARFIDIGLDANDEYRVALRTEGDEREDIILPVGGAGIRNHRLRIPKGNLVDVRVFPITGDGRYAVGHVVLP